MAQVIQQKFDKQLLSQLPHEEFQGRIIVVNNLIDAGKAVRYLMEQLSQRHNAALLIHLMLQYSQFRMSAFYSICIWK